MTPDDRPPISCARCSAAIRPGAGDSYVVKVLAVADPAPPIFEAEDPSAEIDRLLRQLSGMAESELIEQVHRRRFFRLCARCYRAWIEDPTGR